MNRIYKYACIILFIALLSCNPDSSNQSKDSKGDDTNIVKFSTILPSGALNRIGNPQKSKSISNEELNWGINSAAEYLQNQLNANGRFNYLRNLDPNVSETRQYNMLRHCGSIYSLLMHYEHANDSTSLTKAKLATNYLKNISLAPITKNSDMLGIWTRGEIVGDNGRPELKLGGTGLGLISMSGLAQHYQLKSLIDTLHKMATFILYMKKEDGSFYSKYKPYKNGRDDSWTSLYYPGEAALGLMYIYQIDKDEVWLKAAIQAMFFLAKSREGRDRVEPDHWALIATNYILSAIDENPKYKDFSPYLINHAKQICESMLTSIPKRLRNPKSEGCMTSDGRTTPTATRLEGLLNAYTYIPSENISLTEGMQLAIHKGIKFLLNAQIEEGSYKGGIPQTQIFQDKNGNYISQNIRDAEIRIDYVQHALSAMILYDTIFD